MSAYRALGTWRGDGPFGAWLSRIAVRLAVRQLGRRRAVAWLPATDVAAPGADTVAPLPASLHVAARAPRAPSRTCERDPSGRRGPRRALSRGGCPALLRRAIARGDLAGDRPAPLDRQDPAPARPAPAARPGRPEEPHMIGPRNLHPDELGETEGMDLQDAMRVANRLLESMDDVPAHADAGLRRSGHGGDRRRAHAGHDRVPPAASPSRLARRLPRQRPPGVGLGRRRPPDRSVARRRSPTCSPS